MTASRFIGPAFNLSARFDCIDLNLLESAAEQPFQAGFGMDFYPTIYDKAACLFFSIAGGHICTNGNKRTGVLALDQVPNGQFCILVSFKSANLGGMLKKPHRIESAARTIRRW